MNWHRATLKLRGPTGTPWQADTIFGHLCWVVRHRKGEPALRSFLEPFVKGRPPFLLSDGFPIDLLPRPLLWALPDANTKENFTKARQIRKQVYISRQEFIRALTGEVFFPQAVAETSQPVQRAVLKNQISRLTGTTGGEGTLFSFLEYWVPDVTIYLKIEAGYEGMVKELFEGLAETGYGKRKSAGYGAITSLLFEPFEGFPSPNNANAFVSLSPFVPASTDPTEGRWRTRIKYGRLGEEFAFSDNPFKRPVLMLTPGSVFFDSPVKAFYGSMVTGLSPSSVPADVVHYGYALPVPMFFPEDGTGVIQ